MTAKRLLSIIICLLIVLGVCGCNQPAQTSSENNTLSQNSTDYPSQIRVLYSSKDSLDPYVSGSLQNRILGQLIFEPLVCLSQNYEIIYRVAEKVEVSGKTCTAKIKSIVFSDGTPLTANDVVFSFNKAKNSNTKFRTALGEFSSATAVANDTVQFALTQNDPYCANLLTFPILKTNSDTLKNEDNKSLPPIGCGRYVPNAAVSELLRNEKFYGSKPQTAKIITVDCPDNEAVEEAVETQMVDYYYTDLATDNIPKMNGVSSTVEQNHIVFLGINDGSSALKNVYVRQAVSAAIDRKTIADDCYYGRATTALGLFPSCFKAAATFQTIEQVQNEKIARDNMHLAGYTKTDKNNYFLTGNNKPLTLTLIVNDNSQMRISAAKKIKEQLNSCGISINLRVETYNNYINDIKSNRYDLYLSEIRIEDNMNPGVLVYTNSGGRLTGVNTAPTSSEVASSKAEAASSTVSDTSDASAADTSSEPEKIITLTTANAVKGFYAGGYKISDVVTAFTAELPIIPVVYKSGLAIYSNSFKGLAPTTSDLFYKLN